MIENKNMDLKNKRLKSSEEDISDDSTVKKSEEKFETISVSDALKKIKYRACRPPPISYKT